MNEDEKRAAKWAGGLSLGLVIFLIILGLVMAAIISNRNKEDYEIEDENYRRR